MATRGKGEPELLKIVGSVSGLAGTLVGTAVVTGRRIINTTTSAGKGITEKNKTKSVRASAAKTEAKGVGVQKKTKKKKRKIAKQKKTASPKKPRVSAGKKKIPKRRVKTKSPKGVKGEI